MITGKVDVMGVLRIIGGQHRRRVLRFPDIPGLRPSSDRLRETLFNWLGQDLTGFTCLDLFAGSGALGLEASSRGAASVTLVENNAAIVRAIKHNIALLSMEQVSVVSADVEIFLRQGASPRTHSPFDVIFVDPPFRQRWSERILPVINSVMHADSRVYLETELGVALPEGWQCLREIKAGQVHARLLLRADSNSQ